ncbi:MAG: phosphohistidine phosphatase SixA [Chlamydiales bacterium]
MKLYFVRHGEALSPDIDPDQPLSPAGKQETEQVAKYLKQTNLEVDEIAHSVKLRAKQTAEIFGSILCPKVPLIEKEGLKPMDPIEPILEEIESLNSDRMWVGHLPFMEKILTRLVLKEEKNSPFLFCGSAIVCLEGEKKEWSILWAISPKLLNSPL